MKFLLKILLLCFLLLVKCSEKPLRTAEYILPCCKSNPEINECIIKGINHLRPYLMKGIKEGNLPCIEPMKIDEFLLDNDNGSFILKAAFYNITIRGMSEYSIKSVRSNISNYTIEVEIGLPKLEIEGKYDIKGKMRRIPVISKGNFSTTFSDIETIMKIFGKEVINDEGVTFMEVVNINIDYNLKKVQMEVKDELSKKNIIGEVISQVMSKHSEEIIKETKPATTLVLQNRWRTAINAVLVHIPLQELLPDA